MAPAAQQNAPLTWRRLVSDPVEQPETWAVCLPGIRPDRL